MKISKALLGAGCFWGVQETFRTLKGVMDTKVGYSGGNLINPSYEDVCSGKTGHAEVVLVEFNSDVISYEQILNKFWICHDPTQLNKQGFDIGEQYRSVIYFYTDEQKIAADESKKLFQKTISSPIVTEINKASQFFQAEEYHQLYIQKKTCVKK